MKYIFFESARGKNCESKTYDYLIEKYGVEKVGVFSKDICKNQLSVTDVKNYIHDGLADGVIFSDKIDMLQLIEVANYLIKCDVDSLYKIPYGFRPGNDLSIDDILIPYSERAEIQVLQYIVAKHCNLNCNGWKIG